MGKNLIKVAALLITILLMVSACCHTPPPPISKTQMDELKIKVTELENLVEDQNAELDVIETELEVKESELLKLKEYKNQLIDEGYLEKEE